MPVSSLPKPGRGICGFLGGSLLIATLACLSLAAAEMARGQSKTSSGGFVAAGLIGAPAIFFWVIGSGRKARLAACGRCVQQLDGVESKSLTELAAAAGLKP